jgi:hypothetical protein
MGYFKDNTVEIEVNGKKVRVYKGEADKIKAKFKTKSTTKEDK